MAARGLVHGPLSQASVHVCVDMQGLCTLDCAERAIGVLASGHFNGNRFPALTFKHHSNER